LEAFPELKQINENELDLKLAEQYIKFGANQAACNSTFLYELKDLVRHAHFAPMKFCCTC
ncbi:hypothetical protein RFW27_17850, partial [Acinetobacter baumannii]|nr:hypothetical protein [Acinetobacter baumannii]